MKKLLIVGMLLTSYTAMAGDNILSFVVGSQVGTNQSGVGTNGSSTTSTSTTTTTGNNPNEHANENANHTTSTTTSSSSVTNTTQAALASGRPQQVVTGLLYQRRIKHNSPILLGVLVQSNQTLSTTMGVEF